MAQTQIPNKAHQKILEFHKSFPFGLFTRHYICFLVSPDGNMFLDNREEPEMSYHNTRIHIHGHYIYDFFSVPQGSTRIDWFKEPCLRYGSSKMASFSERTETSFIFSDEVRYTQAKRTLYLIELDDAEDYSFGVITFLVNPAEGLFANLHPYVLTDNNGIIISYNHAFRAALRLPDNLIQGQSINAFIQYAGQQKRPQLDKINWTLLANYSLADFIWPEGFLETNGYISWERKQHRGPNTFAEFMPPFTYSDAHLIEYELELFDGCPPGLCLQAKRGDYGFPDEAGYIINFQEKESVVWIKKMGLPINAVKCDYKTLKGTLKIAIFYSRGTIVLTINGNIILSHTDADYPTDPGYNGLMFIIPSYSSCTLKNLKISTTNVFLNDETLSLSVAKLPGNPDRSYRVEKSTTTWGETPVWAYQFINITGHEKLLTKYKTLEIEKRVLQEKIIKNRIVFAGISSEILTLLEKVRAVAGRPISILIEGETGTGKEVLAKYTHEVSDRNKSPFVKLDCTTLPQNLIESELFGNEKGAFTGADRQRIGRLEQADGGTLFIDEISNLSLESQAKLLDFLQSFEITRIGGQKRIKINVRVIAASNKPLYEMVQNKSFREDLYFRINSLRLHIPPLRERRSDIPILAELFLKEASELLKKELGSFHPLAIRRLTAYRWPGNARELRSVVFEGSINASGSTIMASDLTIGHKNKSYGKQGIKRRRIDKDTIRKAVDECKGNISRAAAKLGIGRMTIYRKIKPNSI